MPGKIKFGVIGSSRIASRSVIPAIIKSEHAELHMVGSRSMEKAAATAKNFGCARFGTYEDVLKSDVDAVYVSLPIALHEEWSIKASAEGKHVLCEKSSTVTYSSAKKMVSAAKQNNTRLMEGLMFRFHPQHQIVRKIIADNQIGDLFLFNGMYGFPPVSHEDIRYKPELGGGILNESGCYPVCASRIIFDSEPLSVVCNLFVDKSAGIDTKGHASIFYGGGQTATVSFSFDSYYQANYKVWGEKGLIEVNRAYAVPPDLATKVNFYKENSKEEISVNPADHFTSMVDAFCSEITNQKKAPFNFEQELLDQARVMDALRTSNRSKRPVFLSDMD